MEKRISIVASFKVFRRMSNFLAILLKIISKIKVYILLYKIKILTILLASEAPSLSWAGSLRPGEL